MKKTKFEVKMTEPVTIVIATRNKNKTAEIRNYFKDLPVNFKNLDDFGPIPEVIEDGITFEENAYKKASFTARVLGFPALADDSGLCVDALDGAPGVYSARYGGDDLTDEGRCLKILEELKGEKNRNAAFECVISISVPQGHALTYEAKSSGTILEEPKGSSGFGYDPIFYCEEYKKTYAQLTMEEKSKISHRGKALNEVYREFDKITIWIEQNMPRLEKFICKE